MDLIEMFKIMKSLDQIGEVGFFFSRTDNVWTMDHSLRVKMRVRTDLRQGYFNRRLVPIVCCLFGCWLHHWFGARLCR